jgi:hypothetical protein
MITKSALDTPAVGTTLLYRDQGDKFAPPHD